MRSKWTTVLCSILAAFVLVSGLVGCGKKEESETRTIVIGELTDFTGPSAQALLPINYALMDYCNYVNTEGLIPGVELAVVSYDTKYDSSRFSLGYDSLKAQGARLIFSPSAAVNESLKARAEIDEMPIFSCGASTALSDPPGWVFQLNSVESSRTLSFLKWVHEKDWKGTGPARIGLVGIALQPTPDIVSGLQSYCAGHPDQFSLVGVSTAPPGTLTWSAEVAQYKDCDYLFIGAIGSSMPSTFIAQYRDAGGRAKLIGGDGLVAYYGTVVDKVGWQGLEGTIVNSTWGWWGMDSDEVRLVEQLLATNHPAEADAIKKMGTGGVGGGIQVHAFVQFLKAIIEEVGAKDLTGQKIYDTVQNVSITMPGYPEVRFREDNRQAAPGFTVWKWTAASYPTGVLMSDGFVSLSE